MGHGVAPAGGAALPRSPSPFALRRPGIHSRSRRLLLIAPAALFVLVTIALPILLFLYRAIDNAEIRDNLPGTLAQLSDWTSASSPEDRHFDALAEDLRRISEGPRLFQLARRLNYYQSGYRTAVLKAAEALSAADLAAPARTLIVAADPLWGQPDIWRVLHRDSGAMTSFFLLNALDLEIAHGAIKSTDPDRALYREVFIRTVWMSLLIAGACALLGYPVAYFLANSKSRFAVWGMYAVLLPFWTSLLVRTLAWIVIFQKGGLASGILRSLGLGATSLLYSRTAVTIGMIHVMLPFMILPIYAVMRGISPSFSRAAMSLGASPSQAFFTVYLPQSRAGVGAGVLIVTILSLGFYLTPVLLGSPNDQLISYFIAYFTNELVNWNMAAALSVWLLVIAGTLFVIVRWSFGDRL
jgi:putative spermidine/putrescine transport system permease protein